MTKRERRALGAVAVMDPAKHRVMLDTMEKAEIAGWRDLLPRLRRARAAVKRGRTGCETLPDRCWYCALVKHGGDGIDRGRFSGPRTDIEFIRGTTQAAVIRLFDDSIEAGERRVAFLKARIAKRAGRPLVGIALEPIKAGDLLAARPPGAAPGFTVVRPSPEIRRR